MPSEPEPDAGAEPPPEPRFAAEPQPGSKQAPEFPTAEVALRTPLWWSGQHDTRTDDGPTHAEVRDPSVEVPLDAPLLDAPLLDVPLDGLLDGPLDGPPDVPLDVPRDVPVGAFADPVDPAPAAAPVFAWSLGDADEVSARSSGARRLIWALVGTTVVAVAAVAVALAADGKETRTTSAPPTPAAPATPSGPVTAYVPKAVELGGFDDRLQVTWQPPERAGEVAGFMVVAQSRQGVVLEHRLVPPGETTAVFTMPPMTRDGCVVVASLVRGAAGVTPIRTEPVCR